MFTINPAFTPGRTRRARRGRLAKLTATGLPSGVTASFDPASIKYPGSDTPTVNTYSTDRIVKQVTSTGETWKMAYKRTGACVAKVLPAPVINGGSTQTWDYTCRAGQSLSSRVCAGGTCTQSEVGTCPEVDSEESRLAGWRFYGGTNIETAVTKPDGNTTRQKFNAKGM